MTCSARSLAAIALLGLPFLSSLPSPSPSPRSFASALFFLAFAFLRSLSAMAWIGSVSGLGECEPVSH